MRGQRRKRCASCKSRTVTQARACAPPQGEAPRRNEFNARSAEAQCRQARVLRREPETEKTDDAAMSCRCAEPQGGRQQPRSEEDTCVKPRWERRQLHASRASVAPTQAKAPAVPQTQYGEEAADPAIIARSPAYPGPCCGLAEPAASWSRARKSRSR